MIRPCPATPAAAPAFRRYVRQVAAAVLLAALLPATTVLRAAETAQVCGGQTALGAPDWIRRGVIYEVNVRQFSPSGHLTAVIAALPRLHELGVDVLWLMPIYPIGEVNRKGPLGSYYAVKDYMAVSPEYGTEADFRQLVTAAHEQGFRVILDWVGNHTAWDNPLAKEHPDYYVHDAKGAFTPPTGFDWTDVIQLDFSNPGVLEYQYTAMAHWVKDFDVDGFRCDFATGVPTTFWEALTGRLRQIKPDLFFLAESELPQEQLHAFNASYGFEMAHTFDAVAQGRAGVSHVDDTLARTRVQFPAGAALLYYTSNHDENSWDGTAYERLGGGTAPFGVLSFMLDGIPLIYNGQEAGLDRRLKFFEHDPITWRPSPAAAFYHTLCELKHSDPALRTGASMRRLPTTKNDQLYVVLREAAGQRVLALLNLTARDVTADAYDPAFAGTWRDAFTGETVTFTNSPSIALQSWGYRVLVSQP